MIQTIHKICTVAVLAIGVIHIAATFVFYSSLSEEAVWFAGAGLAGVFVALLNVGIWQRPTTTLSRGTAAAANFLFFFWLQAGVWADPAPTRVIVAGVGMTMVISAAMLGRPQKG